MNKVKKVVLDEIKKETIRTIHGVNHKRLCQNLDGVVDRSDVGKAIKELLIEGKITTKASVGPSVYKTT